MEMSVSCSVRSAMRLDNRHSAIAGGACGLLVEFPFLVLSTSIDKVVNSNKQPLERGWGFATLEATRLVGPSRGRKRWRKRVRTTAH